MINIETIKYIITSFTLLMGYMASVSIAGAFRAWVAKKMGDDTAEYAGFMTLNPFVHIDILGTLLLVFSGFGWGRHVPVNPFNITGKWRKTKIFLATFADVIAYILTAIIAIVALFLIFGPKAFMLNYPFDVRASDLAHFPFSSLFPEKSGVSIIIGLILMSILFLNIMLSTIHIIINGTDTVYLLMAEESQESFIFLSHVHYYRVMLTSLILLLFLASYLRYLIAGFIIGTGWIIAHIIGCV